MSPKPCRRVNTEALRVRFSVEWGYELHSIELSPRNWLSVAAGKPLRIRGAGYRYEAEFFWDYWNFNVSEPGALEVDYGEDGARGFAGYWLDALELEGAHKIPSASLQWPLI